MDAGRRCSARCRGRSSMIAWRWRQMLDRSSTPLGVAHEGLRVVARGQHVIVARLRDHQLVADVARAAGEQQPLLGVEHARIAIPGRREAATQPGAAARRWRDPTSNYPFDVKHQPNPTTRDACGICTVAAPDRFAKSATRKGSRCASRARHAPERQKRPRRQRDIILGSTAPGSRLVVRPETSLSQPADSRRATASDPSDDPGSVMTTESPPSFEAALAELEALVATMEGGQLPLKESLAAYKRGAELLAVLPGRAARTRSSRSRCSRKAC